MAKARFFLCAGVASILILCTGPAFSQDITGGLETSGTAYYRFARPGQNTIQVVVLGGGQSGIYEVGEHVDLARLLALSGRGPSDGRTKTTVQLYRSDNPERKIVFEATMEEFLARSEYPALRTGDMIRVTTVRRDSFGWRDALQIITTVSTLLFAYDRLFD